MDNNVSAYRMKQDMRSIIIYVGGFGFPNRTASAQRALENSILFSSLGFDVVLMGKIDIEEFSEKGHKPSYCKINKFDCYDIRHPDTTKIYGSYLSNIDSIKSIVEKHGENRVFAIIAYQYPALALGKLINFGAKTGIKIIAECTEWPGFEGSKIIRNIQRLFRTEYRMRYLAKKAGNIICASRYLQSYYKNYNTVALPFAIDTDAAKWSLPLLNEKEASKVRRFLYAGSPGLGMSKDYVHWLIEAFWEIKKTGYEFEFIVVGITKQQLVSPFPYLEKTLEMLGDSIVFKGRLSHEKTIEEIRYSDYTIFVRPINRVSRVGFPTKLAEAFCCGVPTITNKTSDIELYIQDEVNGYLMSLPDKKELYETIIRAIKLSEKDLNIMKKNCRTKNPFRYQNFQKSTKEFFDRLM